MKALRIKYTDGCNQTTDRIISDFQPEGKSKVDAFCHSRNERRSFRIDRILEVTDPETNELLNPYKVFRNESDSDSIACAVWRALPAIRALKFFTMYSRGLRKREKETLAKFLGKQLPVNCFSQEELEEWIYKLDFSELYANRDGETVPYKIMLNSIPEDLLPLCRDFAFLIISGSGRKPIPLSLEKRIENEFSENPIVPNLLVP